MAKYDLSIRTPRGNPNHHLWNNHGTWFVHYTIHLPDFTKQRVRASLGTRASHQARRRRDRLFAELQGRNNNEGNRN